jgi:hypothetical protein
MKKPTEFLITTYGVLLQMKFPMFYTALEIFLKSIEKKGYLIIIDRNFSIYRNNQFVCKTVVVENGKPSFKIIIDGTFGRVKLTSILYSKISKEFNLQKSPQQVYARYNLSNCFPKLDKAL